MGNAGATDYALLIDEGGQAGSANGAYAEVFLKDSVSFTDNAVTVSFDMGIAYTGTARELTMTGYAANGTTKVFEMIWDQKTLRFAYVENSGTTMMWGDDSLRLAETIAATGAYDPALMATFTVILDGTDLTYNCTAEQSSSDVTTSGDIGVTVLNSTTELSSIRFAISGTSSNDQAIWLDNVEVQGVPEPATMSLLALGGMAMLRRKKK
ncbi:MAG: PEP-CTERM sorting domain-containing protein [Phycisphaerales bacterium]|nr:PEP-CTERM sorting domain-containing protein [Phycisphaerales bacterium]